MRRGPSSATRSDTVAPHLHPVQCATTSPANPEFSGVGSSSQQRIFHSAVQQQQRLFPLQGKAFFDPDLRPCSAKTQTITMEKAPHVTETLEELVGRSTAAIEPLDAIIERRKAIARPASAMSLDSHMGETAVRYSRPSSALSLTTQGLNQSAVSVLSALTTTRPATVRRSSTFLLTQTDDLFNDGDDADVSHDAGVTAEGQNVVKPVPSYLTREATWKRLWRTKADQERELMEAIQQQAKASRMLAHHCSGGKSLHSTTPPYFAKVSEEHQQALLTTLTPHEKLDVLRKDPNKRRNFRHACNALSSSKRADGEKEIELRRERSSKLLRSGGITENENDVSRPPPPSLKLSSVPRKESVFCKSHDNHSGMHAHFAEADEVESSASSSTDGNEAEYFAAASKMTHEMERKRRTAAAIERSHLLRCARLERAAEDIERVDLLRVRHLEDAQVELRVNWFATTSVLAVHFGSWMVAATVFKNRNIASGSTTTPSSPSGNQCSFDNASAGGASASNSKLQKLCKAFVGLIDMRKQALLKRAGRAIWAIWLLRRGIVRRRRREASVALIRQFLSHRRETMYLVIAVNRFLSTVKYMQSRWRATLQMRSIRRDLALRQFTQFIVRSIAADTDRMKTLKDECRRRECDIANRKGVPRLVKSQMITDLRKEVDNEISLCQMRARQSESVRDAPNVIKQLVDAALEKKHREYHQQVERYSKALVAYNRDIMVLRDKGIIVIRKQKSSQLSSSSAYNSNSARGTKGTTGSMSLHNQTSGTPTPLTSHRQSHSGGSGALDSSRHHVATTNIAAQIDALRHGGKIFVEEPTTLYQMTHGSLRSGSISSARGGSVVQGGSGGGGLNSARSSRTSKADIMLWSLLKERGYVGHIPIRPIPPFFHAVFHPNEIVQMIECAHV